MDSYRKNLQKLPKGTTYLTQLNKLGEKYIGAGNFVGTFPSDKIPKLQPGQCCILNVDRSTQPGSHWVAVARGPKSQCYVYDSFGRKGTDLIPNLRWKFPGKIIDSDRDGEQEIQETNCGARCISWLRVLYEKGIKVALSI